MNEYYMSYMSEHKLDLKRRNLFNNAQFSQMKIRVVTTYSLGSQQNSVLFVEEELEIGVIKKIHSFIH